ncbi:hypothetical protein HQ393_04875 [Chitinibacter bivalviorum]|uniref:Uncharacterized protein n=1 Tax=Chitinibacter bivalviorum TaxID=2739434 RepID=A0A7H9BGH9_9NEIS|nr:hypothetical protein [Chitinibacter bivalviorum]QLG87639.1 hypothetical protein HQ393_04875 [Chitinibacter bivalviorum]
MWVVLLWPLLALLDFGFTVLAMLLAPLIALFVHSDGYLPRCLWWFQTPDSRMDGCDGDANFCATHKAGWWTYVLWQWRNPAAGFSEWLGIGFDPLTLKLIKHDWVGGYLLLARDGTGLRAFEISHSPWNLRIGWKLGNLYRDPRERIPIVHRCNPFSGRNLALQQIKKQ